MRRFELFVGLRYLTSRKRHGFVSFITWISILGVTTGVMAMVVVLSVMTGLQKDLREKILGTNAHLVVLRSGGAIEDYDAIRAQIREVGGDEIVGTTPFIYNQAMLTTEANVMGVVIRGVDLDSVTTVTRLAEYVVEGSLDALTAPVPDPLDSDGLALPGILLGKELALNLGLYVGDEVNVVSPTGNIGPMGVAPKMKRFRVAGIFSSGMYEYDSGLVYVSLHDAQLFFGTGDRVTGIEIRVRHPQHADLTGLAIQETLGFPFYARDWKELNRNLFSALQLEKFGMGLILILIITVAAFNIVSTLFMVVLQKGREIAILKSMGATNGSIQRIFMLEGLIVGVVGAG
ncbi:MAG: FtsX-like permease family protein, partial [Candidatus Dadabacteria bacterium]